MLDARRSSGFDLDDFIAAFDEETHDNTAEFVRLWMKHPGVPGDFRAKYENTSAKIDALQGDHPMKETVLTDRGPKPIGPYSQAVRSNGFLFISGQVAFDPANRNCRHGMR